MNDRRFATVILAIFAFIAFNSALAYDFQTGGVYYKIIGTSPNRVAVTYSSVSGSYSGNVVIPDSVSNNGITYRVTEIADSAFFNDSSLVSVTLPGSLKVIGNSAFRNCVSLSSITIPQSVERLGQNAFSGYTLAQVFFNADSCFIPGTLTWNLSPFTNVGQLTIGDNVRYIPAYIFGSCDSLLNITVGSSVRRIGVYAFAAARRPGRVAYTGTIEQWCNIDFDNYYANPIYRNNLYIGNSLVDTLVIAGVVDTIKKYAFYSSSISRVVISGSVKNIGENSFALCRELTYVDLGDSVATIGDNAFYNCWLLDTVIIPNSTTKIGREAFYASPNLKYIVLGSGVKDIGTDAFNYMGTGINRVVEYNGTVAQWCGIKFSNDKSNPLCFGGGLIQKNGRVLDSLIIPSSVDTIKQYAFIANQGLKYVSISDSVKHIGKDAFSKCDNLASVSMGRSVRSIEANAFANCARLLPLTVPDTVSTIANNAFADIPHIFYHGNATGAPWGAVSMNGYYEDSLYYADSNRKLILAAHKAIVAPNIPSTVKIIGKQAFMYCDSLGTVTLPNSIDSIGPLAFSKSGIKAVTLSNSLRRLSKGTFDGCQLLVSANLGDSLKSTGKQSFLNCRNLSTVTLPNTLKEIASETFGGCTKLTAISIPSSVKNINYAAFRSSGIKTVVLPDSITKVPSSLFAYCKHLVSVTFGNRVDTIDEAAFDNCDSLNRISLPNTLRYIGVIAFSDCSTLDSITIPESVVEIGSYAFFNCFGLSSIIIPDSVKRLEDRTFGNCWNLRKVELGKSVRKIEYGALACMDLDTVIFKTFNPPTMNYLSFSQHDSIVAVVPCNPTSDSLYRSVFSSWASSNYVHFDVVASDTVFTTITVASNDNTMGTARIITPHTCPDYEATISATATAGYHFVQWSDGNTDNPRTLTVTTDTVLVAGFQSGEGIAEAENDNISTRTANGHILLEGVGNERVYVSDVLGRVIYNATVNEKAEIAVRNRGVYFVKVGNRPAQKVVVIR